MVLQFMEHNISEYGYSVQNGRRFDYDGMFFLIFRVRVRAFIPCYFAENKNGGFTETPSTLTSKP